jgi:hypothetical protein
MNGKMKTYSSGRSLIGIWDLRLGFDLDTSTCSSRAVFIVFRYGLVLQRDQGRETVCDSAISLTQSD